MSCSYFNKKNLNYLYCTQKKKKINFCYAIWNLNSLNESKEEFNLVEKGCWNDEKSPCISKYIPNKTLIYCCQEDYCNNNINPKNIIDSLKNSSFIKEETWYELIKNMKNILILIAILLLFHLFIKTMFSLILIILKNKQKIIGFFHLFLIIRKPLNWEEKKKLLRQKISQINPEIVIGKGGFGDVLIGTLIEKKKSNKLIAIKVFKENDEVSFKKELEIYELPKFKHKNILNFVKAEIHGNNFWIITDFQENGSLFNYLKENNINWSKLIEICLDISRGIRFLHNFSKELKIAHRDIKPDNILLNKNLKASIADFGLACFDLKNKLSITEHGTLVYMSPEMLNGTIKNSITALLEADIYSCALVFWEILTRLNSLNDNPFRKYMRSYQKELVNLNDFESIILLVCEKKFRPKIEKFWITDKKINSFCNLIEDCWNFDPTSRLSIDCICESLKEIKNL